MSSNTADGKGIFLGSDKDLREMLEAGGNTPSPADLAGIRELADIINAITGKGQTEEQINRKMLDEIPTLVMRKYEGTGIAMSIVHVGTELIRKALFMLSPEGKGAPPMPPSIRAAVLYGSAMTIESVLDTMTPPPVALTAFLYFRCWLAATTDILVEIELKDELEEKEDDK